MLNSVNARNILSSCLYTVPIDFLINNRLGFYE